jgi:hypothetical protein
MARRVLVKSGDSSYDLIEKLAPDEEHLRETMRSHPLLIPVEDLGLVGPLLVVGRETQLASGRIDLLGLCRSGDVVIAEFKTGTQNSDFRHVLSQLIDYGSDLWRMSVPDFDDGIARRYFRESPSRDEHAEHPLLQVASDYWGLSAMELDEFQSRLAAVLTDGDFNFVVVSQNYRPSVITSADYLNATSRAGRFHLVQMSMLSGGGMTAYSAQIIATSRPIKSGTPSPQAVIDEAEFLNALDGEDYRSAMRDLFASLRSMGVKFGWGSKGTSLRIENPDRSEPISIGWAFPEGANWLGVRHLSLGYDIATAQSTPTILGPLAAYAEEVKAISGGAEIKTKNVVGKTFLPSEVPAVVDAVVEAVERLRDAVNELM